EPGSEHNQLGEDPDSEEQDEGVDNVPENDLTNDSSDLGHQLGGRPQWTIADPERKRQSLPVIPAAHHLIPGNASLKRVPGLHKYISKKCTIKNCQCSVSDFIAGDIGYNVNASENGVWLAGNYAVRRGQHGFGVTWTAYAHQADYADAAMRAAGAQFHDSHPDYSNNVQKTLRTIANTLDLQYKQDHKCPLCGADANKDGKLRP